MTASPAKLENIARRDRFNLIVVVALLVIIGALLLRAARDSAAAAPSSDNAPVVAAIGDAETPTTAATASPDPAETPSPTPTITLTPTASATPIPPLVLDRPKLARDGRISLSGGGVVGAAVEIWNAEERVASIVIGEDSAWTWDGVLEPGTHQLQARMVTADKALLDESESFELVVDEPSPPFGLPFLNEPIYLPDTGDVVLTGTGQPGDNLAIVQDGIIVGAVQVAEDSIWQYGVTLPVGDYEFSIWTLNEEGEPATKSVPVTFTVTATEPPTPTLSPSPSVTATPEEPGPGRVYIVLPGDSLAKIAIAQYNNYNLYTRIIAATNAMAAQDGSFSPIVDPRKLRVGQKLWLPDESQ